VLDDDDNSNSNSNNFKFYCFAAGDLLLTSSQSFVAVTLQSPRSLRPSILVFLGEFG
jgi:hypothetical protein